MRLPAWAQFASAIAGSAREEGGDADASEETTGTTAPEQAPVDAYFAAFNRHDVDAVIAFYSADATMLDPTYDEPVKGKDAIRQHVADRFAVVPDVHDEVVSTVVQPGFAAIELVATGTAVGAPGPFTLPLASFFTIDDGKIVRDATYYDQ